MEWSELNLITLVNVLKLLITRICSDTARSANLKFHEQIFVPMSHFEANLYLQRRAHCCIYNVLRAARAYFSHFCLEIRLSLMSRRDAQNSCFLTMSYAFCFLCHIRFFFHVICICFSMSYVFYIIHEMNMK